MAVLLFHVEQHSGLKSQSQGRVISVRPNEGYVSDEERRLFGVALVPGDVDKLRTEFVVGGARLNLAALDDKKLKAVTANWRVKARCQREASDAEKAAAPNVEKLRRAEIAASVKRDLRGLFARGERGNVAALLDAAIDREFVKAHAARKAVEASAFRDEMMPEPHVLDAQELEAATVKSA